MRETSPTSMELKLALAQRKRAWNVIAPLLLLSIFLLPALAALADNPDWENEFVLHLNTESPRGTFIPYSTVADALNNNPESSPFYFPLDGPWEFSWSPDPDHCATN